MTQVIPLVQKACKMIQNHLPRLPPDPTRPPHIVPVEKYLAAIKFYKTAEDADEETREALLTQFKSTYDALVMECRFTGLAADLSLGAELGIAAGRVYRNSLCEYEPLAALPPRAANMVQELEKDGIRRCYALLRDYYLPGPVYHIALCWRPAGL